MSRALVLDPWLEPIPSPGPAPVAVHRPSSRTDSLANSAIDSASTLLDGTALDPGSEIPLLPRMLVVNSERFTLWKDHFARLQAILAAWEPHGGRIVTLSRFYRVSGGLYLTIFFCFVISIVGSQHPSFSDFPVLPLIGNASARSLMDKIGRVSTAFFDDELEHVLGELPQAKMEIKIIGVKKDGKPRRKLVGNFGDIIIT